jgi:hypothetical protein
MTTLPDFPKFADVDSPIAGQRWDKWVNRFENLLVALAIDAPERKKSLLLLYAGDRVFDIFENITVPVPDVPDGEQPPDCYVLCKQALTDYFKPRKNYEINTFNFRDMKQSAGEKFDAFLQRLRDAAHGCDFGENTDKEIKRQIIKGCSTPKLRRYGLSKEDCDLDSIIKEGRNIEASDAQAMSIEQPVAVPQVKKIQYNKKEKFSKKQGESSEQKRKFTKCYNCGGGYPHKGGRQGCPAFGKECMKCRRMNHFARCCKSTNTTTNTTTSKQKPGVHQCEKLETEEEEIYEAPVFTVKGHEREPPIELDVTLKTDGREAKCTMELDTGSAVSIMPKHLFSTLFPGKKLEKTNAVFRTYTKEIFHPCGQTSVNVNYNGKDHEDFRLFVVNENYRALFGRDWFRRIPLDWNDIKKVHAVNSITKTDVQKKVKEILDAHAAVFENSLGKMKDVKVELKMEPDARPVFHKARPVPYALKTAIEEEYSRMEKLDIWEPVSSSRYASPAVHVIKLDKSIRVCGDYKVSINKTLMDETYPLPKVQDVFAKLGKTKEGATKKFSKIDLKEAYAQLEVHEDSREFLTINTHKGMYRYKRLPYGIKCAPAIFQRNMEIILGGVPGVQCYLDDILITGEDDDEHLENLQAVLKKLADHGLKVKLNKCAWFQDSVEYLGHIINHEGLHMNPKNMEAVREAPPPENKTQLKAFLGLVNYYGTFLPDLATELKPITRLLRNDVRWSWDEQCQKAFEKAKKMIASEQILTAYDPELPVRLACDASPYGLGVVLSHIMPDNTERPIQFASRTLTKTEQNYAQIDREALSIIFGVKKFHQYLYGRKFQLLTDHKPLTSILHAEKGIPSLAAARFQRWSLLLAAYEYDIQNRNTNSHGNADGLSRLPLEQWRKEETVDVLEVFYNEYYEVLPVTAQQIKLETSRDPVLSKVMEFTNQGWSTDTDAELTEYKKKKDELTIEQGCLKWGIRVVIPKKLQAYPLAEIHSAHIGIVKMKNLARSYIWWPGIDRDLEATAKQCSQCQESQKNPALAPLHPWCYPNKPWERIHVDFAGPLHNQMFLIVVDAYSKWPEVIQMKSTTSEKTIKVLRDLFARYGLVDQLVSDNGPQFTSEEFKTFMQKNGIKHIRSAPYHPATNGLAERFVQTMKNSLKMQKPGDVSQALARFLLAYRRAPNATTGETPATLFLGRNIKSRLDLVKPNLNKSVTNKQADQQKPRSYNKNRELNVGQAVWVRQYHNSKWTIGTIINKLGPRNYEVEVAPGVVWKRHIEQLVERMCVEQQPEAVTSLKVPENSAAPAAEFRQEEMTAECENDAATVATPISTGVLQSEMPVPQTQVETPGPELPGPDPAPNIRRSARTPKPVVRMDL